MASKKGIGGAVGLLVVAVLIGAGAVGLLARRHGVLAPSAAAAPVEENPDGAAIPVKVISPRVDPSFRVTVTQPCNVEPYFRVSVAARVAGPVVWFPKDIGDPVNKGEALLVIDVPDQEADVLKKEAVIKQRESELEVAKAMTEKARADVEIARSAIKEAQALVVEADANWNYRSRELKRYEGMAADRAVTPLFVDELRKQVEATAAGSTRSRATVDKANSDLAGALAKLKEAEADEKFKQSMIEVARRDRDVARALLEYATVRAPWDGVITARKVDPGSFVRSSATGQGEPLLTLERSDIVTITTPLPDNYAPFVAPGTSVSIEMSELPGVVFQGKVTRFAPSLINSANDRTMRVEVDLWNGDPAGYEAFIAREKASGGAGLKGGKEPLLPTVRGPVSGDVRLTPGMYGKMRLVLRKLTKVPLIPSSALVNQGGKSYLFLVQDGRAHQYPVEVQVDDGKMAKVVLEETINGQDVPRELTPNDVIVYTNQGELTDGQAVRATPTKW
jgi:multidrug resistance efflux pump